MFETGSTPAESGERRRRRCRCNDEAEYGAGSAYGEFGDREDEYGSGGFGEAEYGSGEAEYGFGETEYDETEYDEAEYDEGEYDEGEYDEGEYDEAEYDEAEYEEQFLPLIPLAGKVLGGLLGGLMKESESNFDGEYGEWESESIEGEAGEPELEFLDEIFQEVLGSEVGESESVLSPAQEGEFATGLLEVSDEEEMEEFLGRIVNAVGRIVQGVKGAADTAQGRALVSALKPLARAALPVFGGAIGGAIAPGIGAQMGRRIGSAAGSLFEMEMEVGELNEEEQQFEVARRVVRLASAAAQDVAAAPTGAPPDLVGELSVFKAARRFAQPLFRRAMRAVSPIARQLLTRPRGGYRGYGGGYRRYGLRRGPRRYWRGYPRYGHRPRWPSDYPQAVEPGQEPAAEPPPPPQPGYRWVAVPIGAPAPSASPPEPAPLLGGPPAEPPPAQSEFGRYDYRPAHGSRTTGPSGRWIRRPGKIIVLDA